MAITQERPHPLSHSLSVAVPRLLTNFVYAQTVPGENGTSSAVYNDTKLRLTKLVRVPAGTTVGADTAVSELPRESVVSYLVSGGNADILSHSLDAPDTVKDAVSEQVVQFLLRDPDAVKVLVQREERLARHLESMKGASL